MCPARVKGKTENALLRALLPSLIVTTEGVGMAMLAVVRHGAAKAVLEAADISAIARAAQGGGGFNP